VDVDPGRVRPHSRFDAAVRRALPILLAVLLGLGALLRLRQYAGGRSLWLDELSVALNLATRGFIGLLHPLDYNQTAPVLFLWAEELATRIGGLSEHSLRFIPLVCGIALLPVAWAAARRLLEPWAAVCSVLLLAVSPLLVWHSNEVKPYIGDALSSAAMLVIALRALEAPADARRWRWLAAGGAVALLGSIPAVFVLAGVALALMLEPGIRQDRRLLRRVLATGAIWATAFLAIYAVFYRPVAQSGFMQRYWDSEFLRIDASLPKTIWNEAGRLLAAAFFPYIKGSALDIVSGIGLALLGIGAAHTARRQGLSRAALLVTPLLLALAASLLRRYPLEPRLFVFAVPLLALLLLEGISAFDLPRVPALRVVGAAALFGFSLLSAGWRLIKAPVHREEARPVIEAYRQLERNEPVMVIGDAAKSWVYYTVDWTRPDSARLSWPKRLGLPLYGSDGPALSARLPSKQRPLGTRWQTEEGRRIQRVASPCAWLYFAHYQEPMVDSLLEGIAKVGGSVRQEAVAPGAQLHRACFERVTVADAPPWTPPGGPSRRMRSR
jgi:4-amino-4-deoxy-L-arabinose transferase-like glycosyltransferase